MENSEVKRTPAGLEVVWSDKMKERFSVLDYHVGRKAIQYLLERFIIEMQEERQKELNDTVVKALQIVSTEIKKGDDIQNAINNTVLKALQSLQAVVITMKEEKDDVKYNIRQLEQRVHFLEP